MVETSNIIAGILSLLFGSLGDIISRIVYFNCSVDKIWTLFFVMPPLSIVTAVLYFMGKIQPGISCASLFDVFLIIIPVVTVLLSLLLPLVINQQNDSDSQSILYTITLMTLYITLFTTARVYKYYKACDATNKDKEKPFGKMIMTGFLRSLATNFAILFFNWISSLYYLQMIPVVGTAFTLWNLLGEFSPGIQFAIPLTLSHFVLNITENSPDFIKTVC